MRNTVYLLFILSAISSHTLYGQKEIDTSKIIGTWKPEPSNYQKDTLTFNKVNSKIVSWGMYYTFDKNGNQSIDYYDKCGNGSGNSHVTGKWKFNKKAKLLTLTLPIYNEHTIYKVVEATATKIILIAKNKV